MNLKSKTTIWIASIFCFFLNPIWSNGESTHHDIFHQKISNLCWVAYAPTNFNPKDGKFPSESSLRKDLALLKEVGFSGVVTFGSNDSLGQIPKIAKELGFEGVIMGIWLPGSSKETPNAVAAANYVDAYCVGHMGLAKGNYSMTSLRKAIRELKEMTKKPISTTEPMKEYFKNKTLVELGDWLFPDAHLYKTRTRIRPHEEIFQELKYSYEQLIEISNKPVLIKTVGYPSGGEFEATEENQAKLFQLILENAVFQFERIRFVYHEAFDQYWKNWDKIEPHWGIFESDRSPKKGSEYIWGRTIKYSIESLPTETSTEETQPITKYPTEPRLTKTYPPKSQPVKNKNQNSWIIIIILSVPIAILWKRYSKIKILRLVQESKDVIFVKSIRKKQLFFAENQDNCFNTLLFLVKQVGQAKSCGEILKGVDEDKLSSDCSFNEQSGECKEKKKGMCSAYSSLNTHRIRHIRNLLEENEIGEIQNIKGKSQWEIKFAPGIESEII